MIAEIVSVGTELLMGQVVNTDAQYIAKHLAPLGYKVFYQITVGDNPERLTEVVRTAIARSDVVLFTGGLGPTDDDLTKETVAAALGLSVVPFPKEMEKLEAYFTSKGRTMVPSNRKQACFPKDAIILDNPNGTAPGCIMESGAKAAILMPGPPRELFPMFSDHVLPYLERRSGMRLYSREIRIFGMGEGEVTHRLRDMIHNQTNPTIAPYVKTGEVTLRVTAACQNDAEGERLSSPMIAEIQQCLGDIVYSTDGEDLPHLCARLLTEQKKTLAVAESCTGGLITSALVDIPGSSNFLIEGLVTYANSAKVHCLNVQQQTLDTFGAVSAECAMEMAEGARRSGGTDIGISSTGIAGPDGGTPEKPVGLVYIGISTEENARAFELHLYGDRAKIRATAVLNALDLLRRNLLYTNKRS